MLLQKSKSRSEAHNLMPQTSLPKNVQDRYNTEIIAH